MAIYSAVACLLFLLLYILSTYINTVNTLNSMSHLALFTSYVFAFFLSTRVTIKRNYIVLLLVVISFGSTVLYVLHHFALLPLPFLSHQDFQFILPTESGHNHLGDLVGLGLIGSLFLNTSPLLLTFQLIFLIVIGVSFSRSALIALVITVFFLTVHKKNFITLLIGLIVMSSILIGTYSQINIPFTSLSTAQKAIQSAFHLHPKPLLSSREKYIKQILKPWTATPLEHLFFGYGPGNFKYASNRAAESAWDIVTETHNILLAFFVESGFLPVVWFMFFVVATIYVGHKIQDPLIYPLLYLFIHFQMDYVYRIPFFMYIFFILCGQITHIPPERSSFFSRKNSLFLISLLTMLVFIFMNYRISEEYKNLNIQLNKGIQAQEKRVFVSAAQKLEKMTPYDSDLLLTLASFYESFGVVDESIRLLDKLYTYTPRVYFANLPHLMLLQKKQERDTKKYLEEKEKEFMAFPFTAKEKSYLDHTCREYLERECL